MIEPLNKDYARGEKDLQAQQQKYIDKIDILGQESQKKTDQGIRKEQIIKEKLKSSQKEPPPQAPPMEKLTKARVEEPGPEWNRKTARRS